jgi:hypothetical protein
MAGYASRVCEARYASRVCETGYASDDGRDDHARVGG